MHNIYLLSIYFHINFTPFSFDASYMYRYSQKERRISNPGDCRRFLHIWQKFCGTLNLKLCARLYYGGCCSDDTCSLWYMVYSFVYLFKCVHFLENICEAKFSTHEWYMRIFAAAVYHKSL